MNGSKRTATLLLAALAVLLPLAWLLQASGVADAEVFATPLLPWPSTWVNYRVALFEHGAWKTGAAAAVLALGVTIVVVACAAAAAYSLVRLRGGRATPIALGAVAAAAFVPPIALLPMLRTPGLQLASAGAALFLPYVGMTLPLAVLLLVAFFRRLPPHLEAAAILDGARPARLLFDILLPLSAPALTALAAVVFLYCWGELLLALPAPGGAPGTLAAALTLAHPPDAPLWGEANALAAIAVLPALGAALLLRRPLLAGIRVLLESASGAPR
jgi:ABC-type glycerol-3-phosphate transport system permease component